jgi:REP element-mobilizing transposase RayT
MEFERKNIRLRAPNYVGKRLYFLTLCFHERRGSRVNPRLASWLITKLKEHAAARGFHVHAYCVMPDHMHILAAGAYDESDALGFVESFKQDTAAGFSRRAGGRLWQSKYYDRILRQGESPECVAWYVWLNPVRKGLCQKPADYPFLGSFTEIGGRLLRAGVVEGWTPPWKEGKSAENAALKGGAT